jgi:threonine/homoserine/homoserine lactone efflux protein
MLAAIVGFAIGFVTSIPIGPINVAVLTKGVRESFAHGFSVAIGAATMDFVYASAAMFGFFAIFQAPRVGILFQLLGFALLVYFGMKNILSKPIRVENGVRIPLKRELHSSFWVGVFLYLSNPTFLGYWITVAGVIQAYKLVIDQWIDNLFFAVGVGVGAAGWFYVLLRFFHKRTASLKPATLHRMNVFAGYLLLAFACYLGYELIMRFVLPSPSVH